MLQAMKLKDKIVVIVGGSRGFGKALANLFIAEGSKVAIVSKNKENVESTGQEIGATPFVADVRDEQSLRDAAEQIHKQFGRIDIWVNSAGVFKTFPKEDLIDMDKAHELFDINFFGAVFGCRTAFPYLTESEGVMINILSSAALDATRAKNAKLYAASKWALRGWIEAYRGEKAESPVKILSVYPGGMKTHLHDEAIPEDFENFMGPVYVAEKVIDSLKLDNPEPDLIIKRPKV